MNNSAQELQLLYKISKTVSSRQHDIGELLNEVLQIMETELGVLRGSLTLRKQDSNVLNIEASSGLSERQMQRGEYQLGEGVTGKVAETGQMEIIADISQSAEFLNRTQARDDEKVAFICVPIIHNKEVIGTISIDIPAVDESALETYALFLEHVAQILASAVSTIAA